MARWIDAGGATLVLAASLGVAQAQEASPDIIAAHVRLQGYVCKTAQAASRDPAASKPDDPVWILRCDDGEYRVRVIPDMAAKVEKLK
ncbi:hypothetical protein NK718_07945 [Alsobacter sp. SYSU M60028]|uniref:PepSY domain-containing protein n=1 Tax=Alsobacter ponti TaxID=2962936 RepID=A0ABT1LAE0_9HYPH|nr:hypothetical protein [Alsobacter ponti]MCP8938445.1 hypothetical protein [Alsobacter ponti]